MVCDTDLGRLGTGAFVVRIAPQCSGYEGMGLVLAFVGGYLWVNRYSLRLPHALLLLPLGVGLAWAANTARIVALVLIGTWGSREVALGGFHSHAGWLAFTGIALGVGAAAQGCGLFRRPAAAPTTPAAGPPTAAYLLPFLALVAAAMLSAAFTAGFDRWYPARVAVAGGLLWYFRRGYPRLRWSWAAVAGGLAVAGVWVALGPDGSAAGAPPELATLPAGWAAAWLAVRLVGSCLVVPAAEELAFRGYLTRRLIAARFDAVPPGTFRWASFLVSSLLFGAMHGRLAAGVVAGMAYALLYCRRRELGDAVLAHATTNAALAAWALSTGDWDAWS
ncbi:MAG: exosortase E/protease, VPEID-CTERM system [Gemmataceae bacterium]|nr:exosortase E/protease, VPEID-CTERM system [Gemmataceae bacterium]